MSNKIFYLLVQAIFRHAVFIKKMLIKYAHEIDGGPANLAYYSTNQLPHMNLNEHFYCN